MPNVWQSPTDEYDLYAVISLEKREKIRFQADCSIKNIRDGQLGICHEITYASDWEYIFVTVPLAALQFIIIRTDIFITSIFHSKSLWYDTQLPKSDSFIQMPRMSI